MLMTNSFYHQRYRLTKEQEEIIAPLLPAPKATRRPGLNPMIVFNAILWRYYRAKPHGAICPLTSGTGTAFITNSSSGALRVFLMVFWKHWYPTQTSICSFKWIPLSARCISMPQVLAKSWAIKQSEYRGAVRPLKFMLSLLKIFNSSEWRTNSRLGVCRWTFAQGKSWKQNSSWR